MNISRSHIVSCCIGLAIGGAASFGLKSSTADEFHQNAVVCSPEEKQSVYEMTSETIDGDVIITPHGRKYNKNQYCSSLRRSNNIKQVRSSEAERNGYEACLKCFNP